MQKRYCSPASSSSRPQTWQPSLSNLSQCNAPSRYFRWAWALHSQDKMKFIFELKKYIETTICNEHGEFVQVAEIVQEGHMRPAIWWGSQLLIDLHNVYRNTIRFSNIELTKETNLSSINSLFNVSGLRGMKMKTLPCGAKRNRPCINLNRH